MEDRLTSNRKIYVIAEAGSCGDGDILKMLQQIDVASVAGVDAVKFQWCSDGMSLAKKRNSVKDGYGAIYEKYLEWPSEWHHILSDRCLRRGVDYMCSAYLVDDVPVVAKHIKTFGAFKVSSFESTDKEFLLAHRPFTDDNTRTLIVSTGMCSLDDIAVILDACEWLDSQSLTLMQCTSAYPASIESMNLDALQTYGLKGYSDHTDPSFTQTGALAATAGAEIIEAHFRLPDTDISNPDAPHAMSPEQLTEYTKWVRIAEQALGTGDKELQDEEKPMAKFKR